MTPEESKPYNVGSIVLKYQKPGTFKDTMYRSFTTVEQMDAFLQTLYYCAYDGEYLPITKYAVYVLSDRDGAITATADYGD